MAAVASAMPSIKPTIAALAPSVVVRKIGRTEWIISEDMSISRLTSPNAQTVRGNRDKALTGADDSFKERTRPESLAPDRSKDRLRDRLGWRQACATWLAP